MGKRGPAKGTRVPPERADAKTQIKEGEVKNPYGRTSAAARMQASFEKKLETLFQLTKPQIEDMLRDASKLTLLDLAMLALFQNATGGKRSDGVVVPPETTAIKELFDRIAGKSKQPLVGGGVDEPIRIVPVVDKEILKQALADIEKEV